jgi:hypothetical protein
MPFNPKLVLPDVPPLASDGELNLPADLAALGDQLTDDAAHLARRYPSRLPTGLAAIKSERPTAWRSVSFGVPLSLAGLALGLTAVLAVSIALLRQTLDERAPSAAVPVHILADFPPPREHRLPIADQVPGDEASHSAISLVGLSGPELEAFLDLIEQQPAAGASVAF